MEEELKYYLTIDATTQNVKPSRNQFGAIENRINQVTGLTINEFTTYVSEPYSFTWTGGIFDGKVKNDNWTQQSIFALDFDKGKISVEEVYSKFSIYDIVPQLWYSTLSSTVELHKFRVVLFLDLMVTDSKVHELIYAGLFSLFPEADPACKNRSRLFLGGRESKVTGTEPISTEKLCGALGCQVITSDGNRTRNHPVINFQTSTNLGEKGIFLYTYNRSSHFSPSSNRKDKTNIPTQCITKTKQDIIDFDSARTKIKVLDEFLKGEWMGHPVLFGLATNLKYIKGGLKLMKDTMEKFNELGTTEYTPNNFAIFQSVKKTINNPMPIYKFSPYPEDDDLYDVVNATKDVRGHIQQLEPIEKIDLIDAEQQFKQKLENVINNGDVGKIYIFRLATSLGKTEAITSVNATIALPTNCLKNELGDRMKVSYHITPDPIEFEDNTLNEKTKYFYSIGLPQKSLEIIKHVADPFNSQYYNATDVTKALEYIGQNQLSYTDETLLTTHQRALFSNYLNETIIFDEDPLNSLIGIKQLQISDLLALNVICKKEKIDLLIHTLKSSVPSEIRTTPSCPSKVDELIETVSKQSNIDSNVFEFFKSSYFMKDAVDGNLIHYVVKKELPKDKKIIILSATIPIFIYKKLYGDRIEVIDITDVKQQGSIIQYTKKSCSRNSLYRYHESISQEVGEQPIITFKSLKQYFTNPVDEMHFGNCSGYDSLKGQNIAVVGTPHKNNVEYFLVAKMLGIEFNATQTKMTYKKTDYNGFRFKFNCFDNEDLRMIQLSLIESELIQAVGRARTLRTGAKVEVYSNFPLRISDRFIY